jgi:hypothetical protein
VNMGWCLIAGIRFKMPTFENEVRHAAHGTARSRVTGDRRPQVEITAVEAARFVHDATML